MIFLKLHKITDIGISKSKIIFTSGNLEFEPKNRLPLHART